MWIYSPKAMPGKSLQFIFRNKTVRVYTFDFNLNFTGWRACWIAFSDMWAPGESDDVQPTQQDIIVSLPVIFGTGDGCGSGNNFRIRMN